MRLGAWQRRAPVITGLNRRPHGHGFEMGKLEVGSAWPGAAQGELMKMVGVGAMERGGQRGYIYIYTERARKWERS